MGVPQIVEPDAGQGRVFQLSKPILRERVRLQRCSISLGYNKCIVR